MGLHPKRGRISFPRRCALLTSVLAWLPIASLRAQTPPLSPPPTSLPTSPEEVGPTLPTSSWRVFVGLYGGYDSNVDFQMSDGAGDEGLGGRLSVAHTSRSPRSQFDLSLRGGGTLYRELTESNRYDGSGLLEWSRKLSPRSTLRLDGAGAYTSTDQSTILIASGLQLPRSQTLTYGGGLGLETRPSERTLLNLGARYDRVDFEEPELVDSESANASVTLSRRLGVRSTLGLAYRFLRTRDLTTGTADSSDDFDSHELGLAWTHGLGRRLMFSAAAGPGYAIEYPTAGVRAERWYSFGSLGLAGQIRRSTLNLQLRHSANPAYGLGGNRLSYGASLALTVPLGRRAQLSLGGVHTWSEDPLGVDQRLDYISDDANATFSVTFLRRLGIALGYVFRRNEPEGSAPIVSHRGALGLTWTYSRP